mmetsp:Transcript_14412/g.33521  ORF Transcript_14412/g.33521 Transcript_14412/m.33521 type:complete len:429 (-) Transcript_14412:164-1450(-)|eukprot:CAMPEP_0197191562 /NCGR_PEP_ID=MMETSP1423-20130617/23617_1 /TAXON_ID=476441 /ORGANISM="Pseudo-nitzschia heimii, Strain UNC1101" /LENGTH=428 /DNA_ID=CAMNT_0042644239 /DNA_START=207 /DNA_END=1493 /DNA_ORIENTATION=+
MNLLPPVHVQTGPPAGDSSLSTQNDDEENRSVNSANYSHYSQSEHSLPNPEDYLAATNTNTSANENLNSNSISQLQSFSQLPCQQETSTPTPRHSNRSRTLPNPESSATARGSTIATIGHSNNGETNGDSEDPMPNRLTIRITTRPIMSWSPQVIHADGSSHTMTIDLPQEFARGDTTRVISQQGWQDLYHIIVTAVAKNTSESILLFWISGFLLMVMALILLFRLVEGVSLRLLVLLGVVGVTSFAAIAHTVVRRVRVHLAVRKCVEECFYDAEAEAQKAAASANANAVAAMGADAEQRQKQMQNSSNGIIVENEREMSMGTVLDGLQELEDVANVDGAPGVDASGGGFGRGLRQRLNSHSSAHSLSNTPNRQRLNTGGAESTTSSNMIFDEEGPRANRAVSRNGRYRVDWRWEYLGMDAVVKMTWE